MSLISRYIRRVHFYTKAGPSFAVLSFLGRFHTVRLLVRWVTRNLRSSAAANINFATSVLERVEPAVVATRLKQDGVFAGLRLRENVLQELRDALMAQACYGAGQVGFPFRYDQKQEAEQRYGRKFLQAHYYDLTQISRLTDCLADDPVLKQIARYYFGTEPVWVGTRAWWSFACGASEQQRANAGQSFHYDLDDYLAVSIFFYLTDVDDASGPHVYVRGSHDRKNLRHVWSRSSTDTEVMETYGPDSIRALRGPAGFGFVEDASCFHKGTHPESSDRLVVQVRYALYDHGVGSDDTHRAWLANAHS